MRESTGWMAAAVWLMATLLMMFALIALTFAGVVA